MTPTPDSAEAVNVRIAELCGWFECGTSGTWYWRHPSMKEEDRDLRTYDLPNYSGSLDAMYEAEKTLTDTNDRAAYIDELHAMTGGDAGEMMLMVCATAAQRAAAFLTTKTRTN